MDDKDIRHENFCLINRIYLCLYDGHSIRGVVELVLEGQRKKRKLKGHGTGRLRKKERRLV